MKRITKITYINKITKIISILLMGALLSSCMKTEINYSAATNSQNEIFDKTQATREALLAQLTLPYESFTLKNGLRVFVSTDRKSPLVAIDVFYHVGSKDEPTGKSGFAHLFEHLMFNGSENYDDEFFPPLKEVGGSAMNGTTSYDRTHYFETVPTPALERVLWLESDRMGHLLGAVTQKKIDEQRNVVKNEKRQKETSGYNLAQVKHLEGQYPKGHPYRHRTSGSLDDLNSASLDDVHQWFKQYYGAANAIVAVAGDIDVATLRPLMEKYFGDIPAGPALTKIQTWVPAQLGNRIDVMTLPVSKTQITRSWNVPGRIDKDASLLTIIAGVLGARNTGLLYKKLVDEAGIASNVYATLKANELTSSFDIVLHLKKPEYEAQANELINEVLADVIKQGLPQDLVGQIKMQDIAAQLRYFERVLFKASVMSESAGITGDANHHMKELNWRQSASLDELHVAAEKWLSSGYYQMTVRPQIEHEIIASTADRSKLPALSKPAAVTFPDIEHVTLKNGIKVYIAQRHTVPTVNVLFQFSAGMSQEPTDKKGLSSLTAKMMGELEAQSKSDIAKQSANLGFNFGAYTEQEAINIQSTLLKPNLKSSLSLISTLIQTPHFNQATFDKLKKKTLSRLKATDTHDDSIMTQLFGTEHPYGLTSNTHKSISSLNIDDVKHFYQQHIRPETTNIVIVGDITRDELMPILNNTIGQWQVKTPLAEKVSYKAVSLPKKSKVILVLNKKAKQTTLSVGQVVMPTSDKNAFAFDVANQVLGGGFTARLNMNLREDKGWSFGVNSGTGGRASAGRKGQRPWLVYAKVQQDKTIESILEIRKEITEFVTTRPVTQKEITQIVNAEARVLAGRYESAVTVLGAIKRSLIENLPIDNVTQLVNKYQKITPEVVNRIAQATLKPDQMIWRIEGDLAHLEQKIRALNLGDVVVITK